MQSLQTVFCLHQFLIIGDVFSLIGSQIGIYLTCPFDTLNIFRRAFFCTGNSVNALSEADSGQVLDLLTILPNGRQHKSMTISDFVTVSANVAKVALKNGQICVTVSCRAATEFQMDAIENQILTCGRVMGMQAEIEDRTPCWEYMKDSRLRPLAAKLMIDEWNIPLKLCFEHGGLECGYFAKNIPGIDIYVIGPIGREVHGPYEWMDLNSCHRVYDFMKKYLTLLAKS